MPNFVNDRHRYLRHHGNCKYGADNVDSGHDGGGRHGNRRHGNHNHGDSGVESTHDDDGGMGDDDNEDDATLELACRPIRERSYRNPWERVVVGHAPFGLESLKSYNSSLRKSS